MVASFSFEVVFQFLPWAYVRPPQPHLELIWAQMMAWADHTSFHLLWLTTLPTFEVFIWPHPHCRRGSSRIFCDTSLCVDTLKISIRQSSSSSVRVHPSNILDILIRIRQFIREALKKGQYPQITSRIVDYGCSSLKYSWFINVRSYQSPSNCGSVL